MAADWHVTRQVPRTQFSSSGRPEDVIDVYFRIDTEPAEGHEDKVTVEATRYNADNAAALIEQKVQTAKAVASL